MPSGNRLEIGRVFAPRQLGDGGKVIRCSFEHPALGLLPGGQFELSDLPLEGRDARLRCFDLRPLLTSQLDRFRILALLLVE